MANDFHEGDVIIADSENPSRHYYYRRRGIKQTDYNSIDLISSLPDEILQHILSFIETKFAIRTSVLSRRWRQICWGTPSLYFVYDSTLTNELINKTLIRYTASEIISIHLRTRPIDNAAQIDSWIEFAMSRKVEKLTLEIRFDGSPMYKFPDIFYSSSSLKQLSLNLSNYSMIPRCTVSWTSLKNLSLGFCELPDELAAQILSGCPILESLTLTLCDQLRFLDLSKSLLLRKLDISCLGRERRSTIIITAPHIYYLRLRNQLSTLEDVSSLIEADLRFMHLSPRNLTCVTKMLQNSPELKKITVHIERITTETRRTLFNYLNTKPRLMVMEPKAEFILCLVESMLRNTKRVETIVVLLSQVSKTAFNKLVQMVPTLHNKVSIVLKRSEM